ncbi:MAG: ABC transporter permease [Acidimicrobiia bacterium]|nr:ABC transporter permease [Acidimicrobiia bacterium]MYC86041.1 ABC transporter permease [Acidimicrobiia bacterium]
MTSFRAVSLVMWRELLERGLSKSYALSWLFLALLVGAGIAIPGFFGDDGSVRTYRVATVGTESAGPGELAESIAPGVPGSYRIDLTTSPDSAGAAAAVADGTVDAALVGGNRVLVGKDTSSELESALRQAVLSYQVQSMVAAGEVSERAVAIMSGEGVEIVTAEPEVDTAAEDRQFLISQVALVLLFMAVMTTGSWVLLGVTEEKTNRVSEVLLSSLRPWQLLAGKIIGVGLLGLLQFGSIATGLIVAVRLVLDVTLPEVDAGFLAISLIWFVLGYLVYATGYAAVGAIAHRPEDAQNAAFPMMVVTVAGYLIGILYVSGNPDTVWSTVLTLIPVTAPFVLPVRAVSDSVAAWEQVAAFMLMTGFIILLIRAAGRVYAGGVFNYRTRIKARQAYRSAEF